MLFFILFGFVFKNDKILNMKNEKIYILNKAYYLKNGDIKYFESSCRLLDSIKNDFKMKNIDIYQDDYPNYDIIKEDLENKENTLLIVDENDEVYAQITSTYDELNSIFNETEVAKILSFSSCGFSLMVGTITSTTSSVTAELMAEDSSPVWAD